MSSSESSCSGGSRESVKKLEYRADIDGLRALAVSLVVAFHVGLPGFQAGFIGVDIFFVLSGYLITLLLINELIETGSVSFWRFYARRVRRLLPAIIVVVTVVLLASAFLLHPYGQQQELAKSAVSALLFVSNIYFSLTTGGYFDTPSSEVPLLHFWSLSVEEQFYVLWPPIVLFSAAIAKRYRWQVKSTVLVLCGCLGLVSFAYSSFLVVGLDKAAYFLMPSRAWQLLVGGLLAAFVLRAAGKGGGQSNTTWAYLLGAGLLLGGLWLIDGPNDYPGWLALMPTLGAASLIYAGGGERSSFLRAIFSWSPCVFLGKLSFSWYLWHWPCIAVGKIYFLGVDDIHRNLAMAAVSLALAGATYYMVELRFKNVSVSSPSSVRKILGGGAAFAAVAVCLSAGLGWSARHADTFQPWWGTQESLSKARFSRPAFREACHAESFEEGRLPFSGCIVGDATGGVSSVLLGDSHADHWSPMAHKLGVLNGVGVLQRSLSACRPVFGMYDYLSERRALNCQVFHKDVVAEISELAGRGLSGVIVSGYWGGSFSPVLDGSNSLAAFQREMIDTVAVFNKINLRVLIVLPSPTLRFHPLGCLARRSESECRFTRDRWMEERREIYKLLKFVAEDNPLVQVLDPTDLFCEAGDCYVKRGDVVLFRDRNHITPEAAERFLGEAESVFRWVNGLPSGVQSRERRVEQ